jgi:hypothetical protein
LNTVDQERAGLLLLVDGIAFRRIDARSWPGMTAAPTKKPPEGGFPFFLCWQRTRTNGRLISQPGLFA